MPIPAILSGPHLVSCHATPLGLSYYTIRRMLVFNHSEESKRDDSKGFRS